MSKILAAAILVILFCLQPGFADVIPPGMHYVSVCTKVTNADTFPDFALVQVTNLIIGTDTSLVISTNCLHASRWGGNSLFSVPKHMLDSTGIHNIGSAMVLAGKPNNTGGYYISDSIPLASEEISYTFYRTSSGSYLVGMSRKVSHYSDNTPDKIETFSLPIVNIERATSAKSVSTVQLWCRDGNIVFTLPSPEPASLSILNAAGQKVYGIRSLAPANQGNTVAVPKLPAGAYLVKLTSEHYQATTRLLVNK